MREIYHQVRLQSGSARLTCWIARRDIKPGDTLTLKTYEEPERVWTVVWAGKPTLELVRKTWKAAGGLS